MTITEAAQAVKRSRQTIYNHVKNGKLFAKRNGKGYDIDLLDLLAAFGVSNETSKSVNDVSREKSNFDTFTGVSNEVSNFDKYVDTLLQQLEEKDKQIGQLHQILAMQQKTISAQSLALEDKRQPLPSLWHRFLGRMKRASTRLP